MNLIIEVFLFWLLFKILFALYRYSAEIKKSERKELMDKLNKMIHEVHEEKHGEQYYWFDKDTQTFITQGPDADAIIQNLKKYYSDHIFIIDDQLVLSGPDWTFKDRREAKFTIKI